MHFANGVLLAKKLLKLIKECSAQNNFTANEVIEIKLKLENGRDDNHELYEHFLILMKHKQFFETIVEEFWNYYHLKSSNENIIIILLYVIIFVLDDENCAEVVNMFTTLNYKYCLNVIAYCTIEDNVVYITQAACKVFDNEYVLENILYPLVNKCEIIRETYNSISIQIEINNKISVKPVTRPRAPVCYNKNRHTPAVPRNTPNEISKFRSTPIPKTMLKGDLLVTQGITKAHEANKKRAKELLEFARSQAFKCSNTSTKTPIVTKANAANFKASKVPSKKDIVIKSNATSLMREAARLVKDIDSEMQKIDSLTQGIFDPTQLENIERDIEKCKQQQHMQDIERKHLQGQLTYEEAIIAKQNVIKMNQEKMKEFKEERVRILEEIEHWRENEQEKIRLLVEKSQNIVKGAKDAGIKLQEYKKTQARLIETETKELLKLAQIKQQEELACRVKLIQELRALQQVRTMHVKEFDTTESPNFGFLCEMSIAELQERLIVLKMELHEELKRRQRTVAEHRGKQHQLIESLKQFVDQSRVSKPKPVPRSPCKLEQTPEIIALRDRLCQAKYTRTGIRQ